MTPKIVTFSLFLLEVGVQKGGECSTEFGNLLQSVNQFIFFLFHIEKESKTAVANCFTKVNKVFQFTSCTHKTNHRMIFFSQNNCCERHQILFQCLIHYV